MKADKSMDEAVHSLCRHIERQVREAPPEASLDLASLARTAGISPFHLQRSFKSRIGVTPREYAEACRLKALRRGLRELPSVTHAIHDAGFSSSSRVYERASAKLGMTPGQYRKGGDGLEISWAVQKTSLGLLMMAATDRGICSVQLGGSVEALERALAAEFPRARIRPGATRGSGEFRRWMRALKEHLQSGVALSGLPLDIHGTAFQVKVWNYLARIPAGETRTYADVARAIGHPAAVRAVGSACARNRVALLVPCHRVIRGDGGLGGYRWGLERKRRLLEQELGREPVSAGAARTRP